MVEILLAVAATVLVAPFLIAPLVVYYTFRVSAQPEHAPVERDHPFVPTAFTRHVGAVERTLYAEGFNLVGCACTTAAWPVERFVAVFENPREATLAFATVRVRRARRAGRTARVLSAAVRFVTPLAGRGAGAAGGCALITDNDGTIPGCPGRDPMRLNLTGLTAVGRLFRAHAARLAELTTGDGAARPAPRAGRVDGDAATAANAEYVAPLYAQLARGDLVMDEEAGELRPTLRGAWSTGVRHLGLGGAVLWLVQHVEALVLLARSPAPEAPVVPEPREAHVARAA